MSPLVGASGGPNHRIGTRIASGPGSGRRLAGLGHHASPSLDSLGTCILADGVQVSGPMACGRPSAGKPRDPHDTAGITARRDTVVWPLGFEGDEKVSLTRADQEHKDDG